MAARPQWPAAKVSYAVFGPCTMNYYGALAMKHWRTRFPLRFSQIPDPDGFFSQLGHRIEGRIAHLARTRRGTVPPGETAAQRRARVQIAKLDAASDALMELALFALEDCPPKRQTSA